MELSCQILEANIGLVRLKGRLDAASSPKVRAILKKLVDQGQSNIIVDLESVPFIDSSGLASLVSGLRLARERGGNIVLSSIQLQAQTVFRLTMLDLVFSIQPTLDDAKRSLT
jgi:anti-sigma B factor antagonist